MPAAPVRRTNINLQTDLVDAAARVLGTSRTTDTVHAALRDVVRRDALSSLTRRQFRDLTPEVLDELRSGRR